MKKLKNIPLFENFEVTEDKYQSYRKGNEIPEDSNWTDFMKNWNIGVLDMDNIASEIGYKNFADLDISISPAQVIDSPTFPDLVDALKKYAITAEDMEDSEIEKILLGKEESAPVFEGKIKELAIMISRGDSNEKIKRAWKEYTGEDIDDETINSFKSQQEEETEDVEDEEYWIDPAGGKHYDNGDQDYDPAAMYESKETVNENGNIPLYEHYNPVNESAPFSADNLIRRATYSDPERMPVPLVRPEEIKRSIVDEIVDDWSDWSEDDGFGSSDMTFAVKDLMDALGIKNSFDSGRLVRTDESFEPENAADLDSLEEDFPKAHTIELDEDQIARLEQVKAEYLEKTGEPHKLERKTDNIGTITEITYKMTPEWKTFLEELRIRKDLYLGYDVEDGSESYFIQHKSKFPGNGQDFYGIITNVKLPK